MTTKVAVAVFGSRVAPRLDCAKSFLLFRIDNGEVLSSEPFSLDGETPAARVRKIRELGVSAIICGAVDQNFAQVISGEGLELFSWVTGEIEDAIRCFARGELESYGMIGPGGCPRGRWRVMRRQRCRRGRPPWM